MQLLQLSIHRKQFVQGLLLFSLSLFFLKLYVTGNIHLLVSDTIAVLILFTILPVMVLSCAMLFWSVNRKPALPQRDHGENCEGDHTHCQDHIPASSFWGKSTVCLLLLSLLAAFSWHPKALGSEMIAKTPNISPAELDANNSFDDGSTGTLGELKPPVTTQNTESVVTKQSANEESQASFAIHYQANPLKYVGTTVALEGFVYHSPLLPPNYFILTRYFVFCCIADAYPIGITVRSSDSMDLKNDTWVQVKGMIETKQLPILDQIEPTNWFPTSPKKPVINSSSIKAIPTPTKPYMMPS